MMKLSQTELASPAGRPKMITEGMTQSSPSFKSQFRLEFSLTPAWLNQVISQTPVTQYVLVLCSFILIYYIYVLVDHFSA